MLLPLVSGWRLGRWLRPRNHARWKFWRWVRVQPGLFWAYDDTWGWMHLERGFGGLCQMEHAITEASAKRLPFHMVSSRTGATLFDWRFS